MKGMSQTLALIVASVVLTMASVAVIFIAEAGEESNVEAGPNKTAAANLLEENLRGYSCEPSIGNSIDCYRKTDFQNRTFYSMREFQVHSYNNSTAIREIR
jgi:hypothetical protein